MSWKEFLPFLALILVVFFSGCLQPSYTIFNVKIEPETPCIDIKRTRTAPVIVIENNCNENFSFLDYGGDYFDELDEKDKILEIDISSPYDCMFAVSPYYDKTCTSDEIIPSGVLIENVSGTKATYGWIHACIKEFKCKNILIPANSSSTLSYFSMEGKWYLFSGRVNITGEIKPA